VRTRLAALTTIRKRALLIFRFVSSAPSAPAPAESGSSAVKGANFLLLLLMLARPAMAQISPALTDLFVSPTSSSLGAPVTLSATVDSFQGALPGGSVSFYDCGNLLATVPVTPANNKNLIPFSDNLVQGWTNTSTAVDKSLVTDPTGSITASQFDIGSFSQTISKPPSGTAHFTFSFWMRTPKTNATSSITINGAGISNILVTSVWTRYAVTFSGTSLSSVELGVSVPSATVQVWGLQLEASGSVGPYVSTSPGSASGAGGTASFTTTSLAQGAHALTARYTGDFNPSTSETVWLWVGTAPGVSVVSSANPSTSGGAVTFTVGEAGGPAGSIVALWDAGQPIGTAKLSLQRGAKSSFAASFTTSSLAKGVHSITASCCGTDLGTATSLSVPLTQVVDAPGTGGAPIAPSILNIVPGSDGTSATVSWQAVAGVTAYYLLRCSGANCTAGFVVTGNGLASSVTSFTDTGLTPSVTYGYQVQAYNSHGSAYSQISYVTPNVQTTIIMYPSTYEDSGGTAAGSNWCTGQDVPAPVRESGVISYSDMWDDYTWFWDDNDIQANPNPGQKVGISWQGWAAAGNRNFTSLLFVADDKCGGQCEWDVSTDNGATWKVGLVDSLNSQSAVRSLTISPNQDLTQLQVRFCGSTPSTAQSDMNFAVNDIHVEGICTNCTPVLYDETATSSADGEVVTVNYFVNFGNMPPWERGDSSQDYQTVEECTGANCVIPIFDAEELTGRDGDVFISTTPGKTYGFRACVAEPPIDNCTLMAYTVTKNGSATGAPIKDITSVSPGAGTAGTTVTIDSMGGFGATQGSSTVTFNGIVAPVQSWSDTALVVKVPQNATTGPLNITVSGYRVTAVIFQVVSTGSCVIATLPSIVNDPSPPFTAEDLDSAGAGTAGAEERRYPVASFEFKVVVKQFHNLEPRNVELKTGLSSSVSSAPSAVKKLEVSERRSHANDFI